MKEYIERAALKERFQKRLIWLKKDIHDEYSKGLSHGCETDMGLIDEILAADVVEVVRCQECKYRIYKDMGDDIGMIGGCQVWGVALPGDFYCAHGARMDQK